MSNEQGPDQSENELDSVAQAELKAAEHDSTDDVEFVIDLDAEGDEDSERRAKAGDRREVPDRRIMDRVVVEKLPRRTKTDRRED